MLLFPGSTVLRRSGCASVVVVRLAWPGLVTAGVWTLLPFCLSKSVGRSHKPLFPCLPAASRCLLLFLLFSFLSSSPPLPLSSFSSSPLLPYELSSFHDLHILHSRSILVTRFEQATDFRSSLSPLFYVIHYLILSDFFTISLLL